MNKKLYMKVFVEMYGKCPKIFTSETNVFKVTKSHDFMEFDIVDG